MAEQYPLPTFLSSRCTPRQYRDWLIAKASAHYTRDVARGNSGITRRAYREAIHGAVIASAGVDAYTGLPLDWHLISTYDNEKSREQRRAYKKGLGDLPTVDHVGDGLGPPDFRICSWRVNDAKHDLDMSEFIELCEQVLKHQGFCLIPGMPILALQRPPARAVASSASDPLGSTELGRSATEV
jgi:hypothetical protein